MSTPRFSLRSAPASCEAAWIRWLLRTRVSGTNSMQNAGTYYQNMSSWLRSKLAILLNGHRRPATFVGEDQRFKGGESSFAWYLLRGRSFQVPWRLFPLRPSCTTRPSSLTLTPRHCERWTLVFQYLFPVQFVPPVALYKTISASRSV